MYLNWKIMFFVFLGLSGNDNYSNNSSLLNRPQFGLRWKMFELDGLDGNGRVCLVFPPKPEPPPLDSEQIGKNGCEIFPSQQSKGVRSFAPSN